ncbi:MAG: hypothetical protein EON98_16485 [Chitinophagaceae bacterium]|nr:MAG: hypothetical protein EON98_16485 [Chitinophagaceae bacterium]
MHLHSHLRSTEEIVRQYDGGIPFALWLKNYFRQYKKFGSKDRKIVSDLCFCFYRLGGMLQAETIENRLLVAQFLCHAESPFINQFQPDWLARKEAPVEQKIEVIDNANLLSLFPFTRELSKEIDSAAFAASHLVQPDLFLRLRPAYAKTVLQKLRDASLSFSVEGDCVRLPNNSKVDEVIELDKEAVVQDKSSQKVLDALQHQTPNSKLQAMRLAAAREPGDGHRSNYIFSRKRRLIIMQLFKNKLR